MKKYQQALDHWQHELDALVLGISLSRSVKDSTKDILRGSTLLNVLAYFLKIGLVKPTCFTGAVALYRCNRSILINLVKQQSVVARRFIVATVWQAENSW